MATTRKKTLITDEQKQLLLKAIQDRINDLEKVGSGLLKKALRDAADPVFREISRLQTQLEDLVENPQEE